MPEFYRLNDEAPEDEYLFIIAMIVSDIKMRKVGDKSFEWTFKIIQDEQSGWTTVTYISKKAEENLKLCKLYHPIGTMIFMNRCIRSEAKIQLEYDEDDGAIVAFRPNEFQANQFLKDYFVNC